MMMQDNSKRTPQVRVYGPEQKEDFILRMMHISQQEELARIEPRIEFRKKITVTELCKAIERIKRTTMYNYIVYERIDPDAFILISELEAVG